MGSATPTVLSFGTAQQHEMMVGRSIQCRGFLIESAVDDAKILFKTLFATSLAVMPRPPKNFAERARNPVWDQPQFPRVPPGFDWR